MADYSITASSVIPGSGAKIQSYKAGAAMDAGTPVYVSDATTSPQTIAKADCDDANKQAVIGVTVATASAAGQVVGVQSEGEVALGAVGSQGVDVFLSPTAGGLCPRADLGTGDRIIRMGTWKTSSNFKIQITDTGVDAA